MPHPKAESSAFIGAQASLIAVGGHVDLLNCSPPQRDRTPASFLGVEPNLATGWSVPVGVGACRFKIGGCRVRRLGLRGLSRRVLLALRTLRGLWPAGRLF
jgi:hypothetical protein